MRLLGVPLLRYLVIGGMTLVVSTATVALAIPLAQRRFQRQSDAAIRRLLLHAPAAAPTVVHEEELAALPLPIRRWLIASHVVGKERTRVARVDQEASMRTASDQPFVPARAREYFTTDPPGFVWTMATRMKGLPIAARDSYHDGHGQMVIKVASLVPLAKSSGPKVDQGTLLRYLGEIVWLPSAALAPYIQWEAVDDFTARGTMTYAGVSASALLTFDEHGRFVQMSAQRYLKSDAAAELERWETRAVAWAEMGGIVIPSEGTVTWRLKTGDFEWYRWKITAADYNQAALPRAVTPREGAQEHR